MRRRIPLRRLPMVAALAFATLAAPGLATPVAAAASPASAGYRLDLARPGDFVAQKNFVQCVGASMQMMLNIGGSDDRTAATQLRLQVLARSLSGPTRTGFQRKGASDRGWSAGLNQLGAGPYQLVGAADLDEAMRIAAYSIRLTGRPVGLLMWAGRHAWVMSGFEATADPMATSEFRVTRAIVLDPLYTYGSSRWGASPRPREAVAVATLGRQFVPRRQGTWPGALPGGEAAETMNALAGRYVLVLPYVPVPDIPRPTARLLPVAI